MEDKIHSTHNADSKNSAWVFFWDLAKVFLVAFGLVWLIIRPYVAEPFIVSGSSMVPNFHNRDYLIVEKWSFARTDPARGDVIVFRYPNDPKQYFIKRIIGLPGDVVRLKDGRVYVADKDLVSEMEIKEPYLPVGTITSPGGTTVWTVGADQYFVLGDNRGASSDSRVWGLLPESMIVGKAWARVLPVTDAGLLEQIPKE